MKAEAFFFDFDGVLVDSVDIKARAFGLLFEDYGENIKEAVVAHHLNHGGMTRTQKIRYYFEVFLKQDLSQESLDDYCKRFANLVERQVVAAPEISGALQFLELVYKHVKCFIVSATPDDELLRIVRKRGLDTYFLEILGSSYSKTENLKYLLKKYRFKESNCRFFGDAFSDFAAAKNCNVPFIGIIPDTNAPLYQQAPDIEWQPDFQPENMKSILRLNALKNEDYR